MRDYSGSNIMHVDNNGQINLKAGRMATGLDEVTTKRYVDSRVSSAGGAYVVGRRFRFNTNGDWTTKGSFCYGSGKLKFSTED